MNDFKRDLLIVLGFFILLFIAWAYTGGPERAKQSGDAYNKFQKPLEPLGPGETYNGYKLKN